MLSLLLGLLVSACGLADEEEQAKIGLVEGFAGMAAADDPRATVVARDVLGNGGNAADAAVAMYFTLAVTLPSRASLGGGGVCVAFDRSELRGELYEFLPQPSTRGGLVPIGIRAMAALHARQGRQRWAEVINPAESLARFGHGVSRAFAQDLVLAEPLLAGDSDLASVFRNASGGIPREGDRLVQDTLATVLGGIRQQGAAYVHRGPFSQRFVEATEAAGQAIELSELRDFVPRLQPALAVEVGSDLAYFSGPPADGIVAAQLWRLLSEEADYEDGPNADTVHLFAEAAMRAFAGRSAWLRKTVSGTTEDLAPLLEEDAVERLLAGYDSRRHSPAGSLSPAPTANVETAAGTSFVVADRFGNGVACSLTMNGLFGSGRVAPGTGIVLAAAPARDSNGTLSPSAVVIGNPINGDLRFAAAASGGAAAPTALAQVMLGALDADMELQAAVGALRFHHGGFPDELFYESGVPSEIVVQLLSRGHALQEAASLGRVNALHCPEGVRDAPETCSVANDPRGHGLSVVVQ